LALTTSLVPCTATDSPWQVIDNAVQHCFEAWSATQDYAVLLYGGGALGPLNRWGLVGLGCHQQIRLMGDGYWLNDQWQPALIIHQGQRQLDWEALSLHLQAYQRYHAPDSCPFSGGWVSLLGYDVATLVESTLQSTGQASAARQEKVKQAGETDSLGTWLECEQWLAIDRLTGQLLGLGLDETQLAQYQTEWQSALAYGAELKAVAAEKPEIVPVPTLFAPRADWQASMSPMEFATAVQQVQQHIVSGQVYQANLSVQFQKITTATPLAIFQYLAEYNPSPFAGLVKMPTGWLVCNSPERLVVAQKGHDDSVLLETRPIAGTRGRGNLDKTDAQVGEALRSNQKERAEHLMLVDLARNDLGRVCVPGSVTVDELLTLERYSHVTHLVSNVRGQLDKAYDLLAAFRAVFPGGTITGCPKLRCMSILAELEPVSRGFYTGSLGWWSPQAQQMDHNILIRSLWLTPYQGAELGQSQHYRVTFNVGAGIVFDSDPEHEYKECLRKAQALLLAVDWAENAKTDVVAPAVQHP
jgi:para-aminobenzoate synthetase component 1